jgi:hypothetical protein
MKKDKHQNIRERVWTEPQKVDRYLRNILNKLLQIGSQNENKKKIHKGVRSGLSSGNNYEI